VSFSDDIVHRILGVGRPLAERGSNNWALTRAQALVATAALERASRVVLGGDVWLSSNGDLAISGDSWHFEPNREAPHYTNVADAAAKARGYIAAYPDSTARIPYFELVVQ
jgi:hypothetical protein